jgi:hypothetical protein
LRSDGFKIAVVRTRRLQEWPVLGKWRVFGDRGIAGKRRIVGKWGTTGVK